MIKIDPIYEVTTYDKSGKFDCYYSRGQNSTYRRNRGRGHNKFEENMQNVDSRRQPGDSRKTNSLNHYVKVSRCAVCTSICHWAKDCSHNTAQKMKFSIKDFFSKFNQIRRFLRIWLHLLKKSLMENFIFCAI